ncbi:hypothetical protein MCW82_29735, partial [Azospirillum doebereinerae]|nr:hypothetical protein [Azospirillum doebereinerae]
MTTHSEALAPATSVAVPTLFLQAALACASTESVRPDICGIHLHRDAMTLRVVSSDGHRLFVGAAPLSADADVPAWLDQGVTLAAGGLKARLALLAEAGPMVRATYSAGRPRLELADALHHTAFQVSVIEPAFPDYRKMIGKSAGGFSAEDHGDFVPTGFKVEMLKGVAEIAKLLGGKDARVGIYARDPASPAIVTFPAQPGALLYALPVAINTTMAEQTAAILAPGIRGTLAALRAHQTRHAKAAADKKATPEARATAQAKAEEYAQRISNVVARSGGIDSLPAPAAPTAPEAPAKPPKAKPAAPRTPAPAAPAPASTAPGEAALDVQAQDAATNEGMPEAPEPPAPPVSAAAATRPIASSTPPRVGGP